MDPFPPAEAAAGARGVCLSHRSTSMRAADAPAGDAAALARLQPAGLVSAYVYGSHAEGRAHAESDLDVGVLVDRRVLPDAARRFEERVRLSASLAAEMGVHDLDLVVLKTGRPAS